MGLIDALANQNPSDKDTAEQSAEAQEPQVGVTATIPPSGRDVMRTDPEPQLGAVAVVEGYHDTSHLGSMKDKSLGYHPSQETVELMKASMTPKPHHLSVGDRVKFIDAEQAEVPGKGLIEAEGIIVAMANFVPNHPPIYLVATVTRDDRFKVHNFITVVADQSLASQEIPLMGRSINGKSSELLGVRKIEFTRGVKSILEIWPFFGPGEEKKPLLVHGKIKNAHRQLTKEKYDQ